jgi:hypothetical protein
VSRPSSSPVRSHQRACRSCSVQPAARAGHGAWNAVGNDLDPHVALPYLLRALDRVVLAIHRPLGSASDGTSNDEDDECDYRQRREDDREQDRRQAREADDLGPATLVPDVGPDPDVSKFGLLHLTYSPNVPSGFDVTRANEPEKLGERA